MTNRQLKLLKHISIGILMSKQIERLITYYNNKLLAVNVGMAVSNTLFTSHIKYEHRTYKDHIYSKNGYSDIKYYKSILYPVYNTHICKNEHKLLIQMIKTELKHKMGDIIYDVEISDTEDSYICIIVKIRIPKEHWEKDHNYSVFDERS